MAKRVIQVIEEVADEVEAAICGLCWPVGWPHLAQTASCEHGEFVRDHQPVPEETPANPEATPTDPGAGPAGSPPVPPETPDPAAAPAAADTPPVAPPAE